MPIRSLAAAAVLVLSLAARPALAQTCSTEWTNPAGGSWDTDTNWSNGLPGSQTGGFSPCITLDGTYTVTSGGADRSFTSLVLGGASGVQTLTSGGTITIPDVTVRPNGRWQLQDGRGGLSDGLSAATVAVEGEITLTGGASLLTSGGTLDVAPGGTLRLVNGASAGGGSALFRIRGTLDASCPPTSSGFCIVRAPIEVDGGTVRITTPGTEGSLVVSAGGTLTNATVDAGAGTSLRFDGFDGVTLSGTLSGAPVGSVVFSLGTFAAAPGGATLALGGTGLQLDKTSLVSAGGEFTNTGLLLEADTGGNFANFSAVTVRNFGTVRFRAGFELRNDAVLRNEPGGTLLFSAPSSSAILGGTGRVENAGLIVNAAGAGSIVIPLDGLPGSTIRTDAGSFAIRGGGTLNGVAFAVAADVAIVIEQERFVVEGTLTGDIQGTLLVRDEWSAGPGGVTFAFGGTGLRASRNTFYAVPLTSSGGAFRNTGLFTAGENGIELRQAVFENEGTFRLASGTLRLQDGAVLRNTPAGTVDVGSSSGDLTSGDGRLENAGLFVKTAGAFDGRFNGRLQSLPGSELRVLANATFQLDNPASQTLPAGTTLTGTGSVGFPYDFALEGTVSPGTGAQPLARLTHRFSYFPAPGSSRLVIDVDAGGRSDTLFVPTAPGTSLRVTLAGALVVRLRPGYTPAIGDAFTIVQSQGDITGGFEQVAVLGDAGAVAFVTELSADQRTVVLRAVEASPSGSVSVSTTTPVGGGSRSLFLLGPGAPGVTAARLDCTDCLDAAAFGTIPAQIVQGGGLSEARFDLTSPRAFGFYDLVLVRPGQPDERIPVTVRPYISAVTAQAQTQLGMRVRPAGAGHNYSPYTLRSRSNGTLASPFVTTDRPLPSRVGIVVVDRHSGGGGAPTTATPRPTPAQSRCSSRPCRRTPGRTSRSGSASIPARSCFQARRRPGRTTSACPSARASICS